MLSLLKQVTLGFCPHLSLLSESFPRDVSIQHLSTYLKMYDPGNVRYQWCCAHHVSYQQHRTKVNEWSNNPIPTEAARRKTYWCFSSLPPKQYKRANHPEGTQLTKVNAWVTECCFHSQFSHIYWGSKVPSNLTLLHILSPKNLSPPIPCLLSSPLKIQVSLRVTH